MVVLLVIHLVDINALNSKEFANLPIIIIIIIIITIIVVVIISLFIVDTIVKHW